MQDITGLLKQHRVDRTLTAPPLRSNPELSLIVTFGLLFKLRPTESRALMKLIKQDHVTRQEMHAAVSDASRSRCSEIRGINVTICRLRKQLKPHGIEIITRCKIGYQLKPDSRDKIRELLAGFGKDVIAAATPPTGKTTTQRRGAKAA